MSLGSTIDDVAAWFRSALHARPRRDLLPDLCKRFGTEYPRAIVSEGARLPLRRISRFSRSYGVAGFDTGAVVSRLLDGSATMTLPQLRRQWPRWPKSDRLDFGFQCSFLGDQPDFPDMLRFIADNSSVTEFESIATWYSTHIPPEEAITTLGERLRWSLPGHGCNCVGAIGRLELAAASGLLRERFVMLREHEDYLRPLDGMNFVAFEAICCLEGLVRLGHVDEVTDQIAELAAHPSPQVREASRRIRISLSARHEAGLN